MFEVRKLDVNAVYYGTIADYFPDIPEICISRLTLYNLFV